MHDDDCGCPPFEETFLRIDERVGNGGWFMLHVGRADPDPPWAYTIGLSQNHSHPELVIVGLEADASGEILGAAAGQVEMGNVFRPGTIVLDHADTVVLRFGAVHATHWRTDRFAMWRNYYEIVGDPPPAEALQVIWPDLAGRFPGDRGFAFARRTRSLARPAQPLGTPHIPGRRRGC